MPKKDFIASLISGACIGAFAAIIVESLSRESAFLQGLNLQGWRLISFAILCFGLVCVVLGLGGYIGRKSRTIYEALKFVVVGGLNTLVDFAVLNLLILATGESSGVLYSVFKGISFVVAVANSYIWNKWWTFSSQEKTDAARVAKFFGVSVIGFGINVGIASLVVNAIAAPAGITPALWANIGAVAATALSMVWNFAGYKLFVFNKK
jgi:putative flippase GtrA